MSQSGAPVGLIGAIGPMGPPGPPGRDADDPTLQVARIVVLRAAVEELINCKHAAFSKNHCADCGASVESARRPALVERLAGVFAATGSR